MNELLNFEFLEIPERILQKLSHEDPKVFDDLLNSPDGDILKPIQVPGTNKILKIYVNTGKIQDKSKSPFRYDDLPATNMSVLKFLLLCMNKDTKRRIELLYTKYFSINYSPQVDIGIKDSALSIALKLLFGEEHLEIEKTSSEVFHHTMPFEYRKRDLLPIIELFIDKNANFNAPINGKKNALHYILQEILIRNDLPLKRIEKLCIKLVKKGSSLDFSTNLLNTDLDMLTSIAYKKMPKLYKEIITKHPDYREKITSDHFYLMGLEHTANILDKTPPERFYKEYFYSCCISLNEQKIRKFLEPIENPQNFINQDLPKDLFAGSTFLTNDYKNKETFLEAVCSHPNKAQGNLNLEVLIQYGADVNKTPKGLFIAIENNNEEIVNTLIDNEADLNIPLKEGKEVTTTSVRASLDITCFDALTYALAHGNLKIATTLIKNGANCFTKAVSYRHNMETKISTLEIVCLLKLNGFFQEMIEELLRQGVAVGRSVSSLLHNYNASALSYDAIEAIIRSPQFWGDDYLLNHVVETIQDDSLEGYEVNNYNCLSILEMLLIKHVRPHNATAAQIIALRVFSKLDFLKDYKAFKFLKLISSYFSDFDFNFKHQHSNSLFLYAVIKATLKNDYSFEGIRWLVEERNIDINDVNKEGLGAVNIALSYRGRTNLRLKDYLASKGANI